ncbi:PREDICTED: pentatricopeptide repeat-containing protein At4g32450, mitochondrial-like [Tarenaya hassleriana]|uniref:pentatricopeptide repeat-containing protein At4g32450, mitochondrial-like n=1 Tax=Tarenaya hassleriana TaxID=28532 RepID=UPI00053CA54C|nr:PREDICTED: pentatricopeptide repeat-containing protein At4g32450, mitochondrial-like [Tarenaya hassleriana]
MYTRKVSISVVSLPKVCRSSSGSIALLDKLLLRDLSTAAERGDFLNPNGYHADDSSGKTNGFDSGAQNPHGFQQNLNPSAGFRGNHVNGFVTHSAREDEIAGQNPNGVYAGPDRFSLRNENPRNSGRGLGGFDVYNGKNDRNLLQNPAEIYSGRMQGSWQNRNGVYGERSQGFQQNWNIYSQNQPGSYGGGDKSVHQQNRMPPSSSVNSSYSYSNGERSGGFQSIYGQNRTGSCGGAGDSVRQQNHIPQSSRIQTQSRQTQSQGSNYGGHGETWQKTNASDQGNLNWNNSQSWQNPNTSSGGQYWTNSDNQNGWSYQPDNVSYANMESDVTIEEFDAFCGEGQLKNAVNVIKSLTSKGHVVDLPRLLQIAQLCGEAEALQEAKTVHKHFSVSVSVSDISSNNRMIEMFSSCGSVVDALSIFEKMVEKNSETWYTMIRCLAKNGLGEDAIDMFARFKHEGNKPDGQVFKGVFHACSVLGDINEGLLHFEAMYKDHGVMPTMEHYVSIVEMLAAPGYLGEALEFVEKMPMEPSVDVWETLMNLSWVQGNLELGDRCAEMVEQLDATRLNKHSRAGLIPAKESDIAKEKLKKISGIPNPLEIRGSRREFRAGDTAHPDKEKLYGLLRVLKKQMVEMGYVPLLRCVLHDVHPEEKEEALLGHSERLAFALSLLATPARYPIRVMKSLRICVDCHNAINFMSKIVGRELVHRDAKRFHHHRDGSCSCKDYW